MSKRKFLLLLVGLTLAVTGLVADAPVANADHGCLREHVCAFRYQADDTHFLQLSSAGDRPSIWQSVGPYGGYVLNNGVRYANNDHIYLLTRTGTTDWWTCLHYPETGGSYRTRVALHSYEIIRAWFWGRECPDDVWHLGNPPANLYQ